MKKIMKVMLSVAVCMLLVLSESLIARAGTINTVDVTQNNGVLTVGGTVDSDVLACAILVYDATGTTLISMETCGVTNAHTFTHTFSTALGSGDYLVKVADYAGGAYAEDTITVPVPTPTPTPTSTTATTLTEETEQVIIPIEHVVVRGENLFRISKKYGIMLKELLKMNPQIKNPNLIFAGQKIIVGYTSTTQLVKTADEITDAEYYTVQRGDYLYKIARLHGMTLNELVVLNPDILKQKYIFAGQQVRVK